MMNANLPCVGALFKIKKLEEIDSSLYGKAAWSIVLNAIDVEGLSGASDFFEGDTQGTINGQEYVYCIALQNSDKAVLASFREALEGSEEFNQCVQVPGFMEGSELFSQPLIHSAHVKAGNIEVKTGSPLRYALAEGRKARRQTEPPGTDVVPERTRPASKRTAIMPDIPTLDALKGYLKRVFPKNSRGSWFFLTPEELCDIAEATHGVLHFHWDEPEHGGMSGDEIEVTVTETFKHDKEDQTKVSTLTFSGLAAFASHADAVAWCNKNNFDPSLWGVEGHVATKLMGSEGNTLWPWEKEEFRDREVSPSELWQKFCRRRQDLGVSDKPKKAGCFVATACYGSSNCPEVNELRQFRDEMLLANILGRALVNAYYTVSPPIAEFLNGKPTLCVLIREQMLNRIVARIRRGNHFMPNKTNAGQLNTLNLEP